MYQSVIGQHSVDGHVMVGRHLVDSQKIAVRYFGRESAGSRSIYRSRFLSICIVVFFNNFFIATTSIDMHIVVYTPGFLKAGLLKHVSLSH